MPAARSRSPQYERSVFSYRGTSFRNRFIHEWEASTTHLLALKPGLRLISAASSPSGRICGTYPFAATISALPVCLASRQRFSVTVTTPTCTTTLASRSLPIPLLSCTLAPVTTIDNGMPRASTRTCLLVPFFPPVRGVGSNGFLRQRCFDVRSVGGLPFPGDASEFVVFGKSLAPDLLKQSGPSPLLKARMQRRTAQSSELIAGKGFSNDPGAKHVDNPREVKPVATGRLLPTAGLSLVRTGWISACLRQQCFDQTPEFIGYLPSACYCHLCVLLIWLADTLSGGMR